MTLSVAGVTTQPAYLALAPTLPALAWWRAAVEPAAADVATRWRVGADGVVHRPYCGHPGGRPLAQAAAAAPPSWRWCPMTAQAPPELVALAQAWTRVLAVQAWADGSGPAGEDSLLWAVGQVITGERDGRSVQEPVSAAALERVAQLDQVARVAADPVRQMLRFTADDARVWVRYPLAAHQEVTRGRQLPAALQVACAPVVAPVTHWATLREMPAGCARLLAEWYPRRAEQAPAPPVGVGVAGPLVGQMLVQDPWLSLPEVVAAAGAAVA